MNNIINELNKKLEHNDMIIKDLLKENTELSEKNIELENRIEEAIEYIYKNSQYNDEYGLHYTEIESFDELLEILK